MLGTDILSAFIDGALYFGKGQIRQRSNEEDSDLATMAAQMQAYPQAIWRFLIGEQSLQGG